MGEGKVQGKISKNLMAQAVKLTIEVIGEDAPSNVSVMTKNDRMQVSWDKNANTTTMGELIFFAEVLEVAGGFGSGGSI